MPPRRPRVLYLCQLNPWRLDNGGIIRNYWLLSALATHFEIDLVTADDAGEPVPPSFAARCAAVERFPRPSGWLARPRKFARSLPLERTFVTSGNVTRRMKRTVATRIASRGYAAAITEIGLLDALPAQSPPVVYAAHNCEAALLSRRAPLEPVVPRAAMTVDAWRLRRYERRLIERAILVTPCSWNDLAEMRAFAPAVAAKSVVVPNGVDTAWYAPVAASEGGDNVILLTGSFDWVPNRRGLDWFIDEVLPRLDALLAGCDYRIRVAGRMSRAFARSVERRDPRITAAPNVPDMRSELRTASVVAAPVLASSGTRLRILEAWAAGRPVVTTPQGALGLDHTPGRDLLVCGSAAAFAQAIALLLRDPSARTGLRAGGLARAAANDWAAIGSEFVAALQRCIAPSESPTQGVFRPRFIET